MGVYDKWNLPAILSMFEHESTYAAEAHEKAWKNKLDLLSQQRQRLETLTAQLSVHWDPAKSEAAQVFIGNLKEMIKQINGATTAVQSVMGMQRSVTAELQKTKVELEKLLPSYYDKAAAARAFNTGVMQIPAFISPDSTMPGLEGMAMRMHRERLDRQAREIMATNDQNVEAARSAMTPISAMKVISSGGAYQPKDDNPGGSGGRSGGGSSSSALTFNPPPPSFVGAPLTSATPELDAAPILAGGPGSIVQPPPPPASPPLPPGGPTVGPGTPVIAPPNWLTRTPPAGPALRSGVIGEQPTFARTMQGRSGTPVNGVLGGEVPPGALGRGGLPSSMSGTTGGTLNGSTGKAPVGGATSRGGVPQVSGPASRAGLGGWQDRSFAQYAERRSGDRTQQRDGDEGWQVEEGVSPILRAPEPPTGHDAGTGVIGLDR